MSLWTVALHVLAVTAAIAKPPGIPMVDLSDEYGLTTRALPPYDTVYYFDQLIDHDDPSKGTFQQRYWHTSEYYQPGSWSVTGL